MNKKTEEQTVEFIKNNRGTNCLRNQNGQLQIITLNKKERKYKTGTHPEKDLISK